MSTSLQFTASLSSYPSCSGRSQAIRRALAARKAAGVHLGRRPGINEELRATLLAAVNKEPGVSWRELARRFEVSPSTVAKYVGL